MCQLTADGKGESRFTKRKRGITILLSTAIIFSICCFGNMAVASVENEHQKASPNDAEKVEVLEATMSNALLMAVNTGVGDDFEIDGTTLVKYRGNEKRVVIPDGIEVIGKRAFTYSWLEEVIIPDSVKRIEEFAFEYARIKKIEIGSGLDFIGERAFDGCPLQKILVSEQNTKFYVEQEALINREKQELVKYCSGSPTKNYVIPDSVKKLASCSFTESSNLETIIISDSVESTGKLVFYSCDNLQRIEIGRGLESIYSCIFTNCFSLEEFIVSPDNKAFYSDDGVLIGYFSYYPAAKKGKYYRIPDENITRFYAENNPYIESIYISDKVKEIELEGTSNLRKLEVGENNRNYRVVDDVLFDYYMQILECYPNARPGQNYIVPDTVRILNCRLSDVKELKNIFFLGSCPRKYPGQMEDSYWYDWVHGFSGEKIYDIYYYDSYSWSELREGYNNNFGYPTPRFEMRFHPVERYQNISIDIEDAVWLGESVKLKVIEVDLEHGIVKEKMPGFWRVESGNNVINDEGIFTALAEGTTKVVAGGNELPFDVRKEILVKKKLVQSIAISPSPLSITTYSAFGFKQQMSYTILPEDAYDKSVKWYSTNPDVVVVDEQGTIMTISSGEAEIYCVAQDGGSIESNHCIVTVVYASGSGGSGSSSSGGSSGSSGGSSSSGGGSGSSGGGSSSSGGGPASGGTRSQENSSLPSYVVQGTWNQNVDGSWSFTDSLGNKCINKWKAVANPYADISRGQQGFDWFRFDESGKMVTGWYMIDGYYYYFNPNSDGHRGRMYVNEITPDGYRVNENGKWIK